MLAGLPYVVWPFGSLFILGSRKREDPFLCYHAVQGLLAGGLMLLGLFLLMLGMFITFRVMPGTSSYVPAFFSLGTFVGGGLATISLLFVAIFLGWRATEGEMLRIPYLGDFAEEKMLDQTGMTRRQFEAMLEASVAPEQEEEIPFPEVTQQEQSRTTNRLAEAHAQAQAQAEPRQESAMDRLEAARAARAQRMAQAQQEADQFQQIDAPAKSWNHQPAAHTQRSQSVVREVDLIGHYQDKKSEQSPEEKDVLRQWLSSVDEA